MLFSRLLNLAVVVAPIFATPITSADDTFANIEDRATTTYAVTGVPKNGTHPRLDIRTLQKNTDQWNLYLLAMAAFQNMTQSQKLSYYQIAGIHGVPNVPWDGVAANSASGGAVGYCTHSSILFPTWHRAYLALFEQVFFTQVQTIVNTFPVGATRTKYAAAASTIRLPYWDAAAIPPSGLPTLPYVVTASTVSVVTPTGTKTITNPLFRYGFHPLVASDMIYNPWAIWQVTFRYPTSNSSAGATSQNNLAVNAVENNRQNLQDNVYNLFTKCSNYAEFSNDASASSSSGCSVSLESIHNTIHALVGGSNNGHMTWLWWAAFDPIFWLHHANVDRLLAMWQAIYPDTWTIDQVATGSSFTIAQGSTQGLNSPLTPFHSNTKGAFLNSTSVRFWTHFGYTYPEFADSNGSSAAIKSYVNNMYGPSATATAGSSKAKRTPNPSTEMVEEREIAPDAAEPTAPARLLTTPLGDRIEYIVNIHAHRFGLDGSYVIYIFMGKPASEDPASWAFDPALVGSNGIFATAGMSKNKISVSGAVPLTRALTAQVATGALADLEEASVVPFLQTQLQWRIATADIAAVPANQVPGLQISVVTANSTIPASPDEFPTVGKFTTLYRVTNGRAGGISKGQQVASEEAKTWVKNTFGRNFYPSS